MLYIGEEVGALKGRPDGVGVDIAVDPLEGTNLCATGAPDAIAVLAAAERGGLLHAPDVYMEKLIVGPTAQGPACTSTRRSPRTCAALAKAFERDVEDLTIVVLDRPRHEQLIADIRSAGARIRLIGDGDLSAGIAAAVRGTGVHAVMGTGGAPEGVITAAAMRCLGGEIQARLVATDDEQQRAPRRRSAIHDLDEDLPTEDLAPGEQILSSLHRRHRRRAAARRPLLRRRLAHPHALHVAARGRSSASSTPSTARTSDDAGLLR